MTGQTYEQQKELTLKQYNDFQCIVKAFPDVLFRNINLDALRQKSENIKKNKFTLMIVGEAKSGKSTFINAFLKSDILPTSVLQCTSAIIEITYSEIKQLTYHTAGGSSSHIEGDHEIQEFLKNNAALIEEYREIPVASIDQVIIHRKGTVPPSEIEESIKVLSQENIYHLDEKVYALKIRQYFNERAQKWQDIIVRIEISYPFAPEMHDIKIIDSPGVNALGQVGQITEDYIDKANAVVFIKSLAGQALESKSFENFLRTKNAARHKESLFLFLSSASNLQKDELEKLVSEARRMYCQYIKTDKIIPIDSKVQLYINRLSGKTEKEIFELMKREHDTRSEFAPVSSLWFWNQSSLENFFDELETMSGFQEINRIFELYAKKAQRIALFELLTELEKAYTKLYGHVQQEIDMLKKKIILTPEQLAVEIKRIIDNLESLKKDLNLTIHEIEKKYVDKKIPQKKSDISKSVMASLKETDINVLEKKISDITRPLKKFKETMALEVIAECNSALKAKCQKEDFDDYMKDILVPDFPVEEIVQIKENVKEDDDVYDNTTSGVTFTETHRTLNPQKYHEKVVQSIATRLDSMLDSASSEFSTFVISIFAKYRTKLSGIIDEEQALLEGKEKEKTDAKDLTKRLEEYKEKRKIVDTNQMGVIQVRKEIENGLNF